MANEILKQEEQKFLNAIQGVKIPNNTLNNVDFIIPKNIVDFEKIPIGGGCYWIWTSEPVFHFFHKNPTPEIFDGGEIIYNGIAKDDVKGRVKHHLLGEVNAGWSGISLDIYFDETTSHRKKALSEKGKVPFIKERKIIKRGNKKRGHKKGDEIKYYKPIRTKEDVIKIYLSDKEKNRIQNSEVGKIYFRNGIKIFDEKHSEFEFRVYYMIGLSPLYVAFIEKKWREDFGLPKLCSYLSGR